MTIPCCYPFDPSNIHQSSRWSSQEDANASFLVKEAGKKLKYDQCSETDQITEGLSTLLQIFENQIPFCPLTLGVRRNCILLLNTIQVFGVKKESFLLAKFLLKNIGQSEPKLVEFFIKESIDVLRILHESSLAPPGSRSVEVFHSLVAAVRQTVSSSSSATPESSASRGIVVPLPDDDSPGMCQDVLCQVLHYLIVSCPQYRMLVKCDEISFQKIFMYKMSCLVGTSRAVLCQEMITALDFGAIVEIEDDQDETQRVPNDELVLYHETLMVENSHSLVTNLVSPSVLKEDVIRDVKIVLEKKGLVNSWPEIDDPVNLLVSNENVVPGHGLLGAIQRRPFTQTIPQIFKNVAALVSREKNHFPEFHSSVIERFIGEFFWKKDTVSLTRLAATSNPISTLNELLIMYMDIPVAIILLVGDTDLKKFEKLSEYLSSLTNHSFHQLIEACITEVLFRLTRTVKDVMVVSKCLEKARLVVSSGAGGPTTNGPPTTKKQKLSSPKRFPGSAIDAIIHDNFLHLIHLIEEVVDQSVEEKSRMLEIVLSVIDPQTIRHYAVRTIECCIAQKLKCWKKLFKIFSDSPELVGSYAPCFAHYGRNEDLEVNDWFPNNLSLLLKNSNLSENEKDFPSFVKSIFEELNSPERIPGNKLCCVILLNERIDENSEFEIFLLKAIILEKLISKIISALVRLSKHFADNTDALVECGKLIGTVAQIVSGSHSLESTDSTSVASYSHYQLISSVDGMKKYCARIVTTALVPNIRMNSHAFAVQEILAINGGLNFVQKYFSPDNQLVLNPYLSSSYRISSAPSSPNLSSSSSSLVVIQTPFHLFEFLSTHIKGSWELVIRCLKIAAINDPIACNEALPGLVELVASSDLSDFTPVYESLRIAFQNILNKYPEIIFSIFDHLNGLLIANLSSSSSNSNKLKSSQRNYTSREFQFFQNIVSTNGAAAIATSLLVKAAIRMGDFERALSFMERSFDALKEDDVVLLSEIYEGLNDPVGVRGVCSLWQKQKKRSEKLDRKIAKRDQLVLWPSDNDSVAARELIDSGQIRCAFKIAPSGSSEQFEACWKLSNWTELENLINDSHPKAVDSIHKSICESLVGQTKCEKNYKMSVTNLLVNLNRKNLVTVALVRAMDRLHKKRQVIDHWEQLTPIIVDQYGSIELVELFNASSKFFRNDRDRTELFEFYMIRLLRKQNRIDDLKSKLFPRPSPTASMNHHCEWARGCWTVGERETARSWLSQVLAASNPANVDNKWEGELLLLRWSAELEVLIPRLVVASYRDLLKKSVDRSPEDRGKVAYHFAAYLDTIGGSTEVWNKSVLVKEIAQNFFDSIKFDSDGKRLLFTINRLLQLHWELSRGDANQILMSNEILKIFVSHWQSIPSWVWYVALPQLVSRLTSESAEFVVLVEKIIVAVGAEYPRQSAWILAQLLNSKLSERKSWGTRIFAKIIEKSDYPNIQQFVNVMRLVAESLVNVARLSEFKTSTLSESKDGSRLLRDSGGLLVMPVQDQISTCAILASGRFSNEIRIGKFLDNIYVYQTKAKPKRISVLDSCGGRTYQFILKVEKKTDLRKDSRTMEFVNVVNHEMKRKLASSRNMQTYSVLILSEDCALIEFVPNLTTLRKIIEESLTKTGKNVNMYLNKEVMNKLSSKHEGFAYFQSLVAQVPPMVAEWAWNRFGWNAKIWLRNRNTFTQSQALWCIVGYIIGLGDRHPDNILIDEDTSQVVHVDFDCIFSRGMSLQIPELVPFRLTKICVSGMGVTGVEGLFRTQCEEVMKLLRNKKKTLLAVLHAFIADPLIDWQATADKNGTPTSSFKKAKDVITAIEKKLNGYVDVGETRPPQPGVADEKLFIFHENAETARASGLGKDRGAALSVEGQVDELIKAAVCERNLARMYLGWMPLF